MLVRVLSAALIFAACGGPPPAPADTAKPAEDAATSPEDDLGEIIAVVDGIPIGSKEFLQVAARRVPADGASALSEAERQEILEDLVDQKVLYLEARRLGIDQDPKIQRQMVQLLLRKTVFNQVKSTDFTDDELKAYFEEHKSEFIIPEKVRVRHIYVKGEPSRTAAEAESLIKEAAKKAGKDVEAFATIASEINDGPYKSRGGDVGLITKEGRAGLAPEVVEKAFTLAEGQISEPFQADGGWNLVAVVARKPQVDRTFEQMKGAIMRRAKAEKHEEIVKDTVKKLREGAKVEVYQDKVTALQVDGAQRMDGLRNRLPPDMMNPPGLRDPTEGGGAVPGELAPEEPAPGE